MAASLNLEGRVAQVWGLTHALRAAGKSASTEAAALFSDVSLAAEVEVDAGGRPVGVVVNIGGADVWLPLAERM